MNISYSDGNDLLYIRLDEKKQDVVNKHVSECVVMDIDEGKRIVGIEILNAAQRVNLENLLPVKYEISKLHG